MRTGESKVSRGWRLTVTAWRLMRRDRTMIVLAQIGTFCGLAGAALMLDVSGVFSPGYHSRGHLAGVALVFLYPLTFVSVFFNVALTAAAAATLEGRRMGVGGALGEAWRRVGRIAGWSLLSALVGALINQVVSRISISAWTVVATIPLVFLFMIGLSVRTQEALTQRSGIGIALIVLAAVAFAVVGAFANATRQVFNLALFRYATGLETPGFAAADLEEPFKCKRGGRDD